MVGMHNQLYLMVAQNKRQILLILSSLHFLHTSYLLAGWSREQKYGELAKLKPINEMVTATINFAIAMGRLEDRGEERRESKDSNKITFFQCIFNILSYEQ